MTDLNNNKIVLIGGGGHCKSVIDVIEQENKYKIAGIIDLAEKKNTSVFGYPVIGQDKDLPDLVKFYKNFCITIGQIKSAGSRIRVYNTLKELRVSMPVIISPRAYVSKHSQIGEGTIILHDVLVNSDVCIGVNCILNTKSLIEHEVKIGNHCHISTNSIINGQVILGDEVFVGSGVVINNNISVSSGAIIASQSLVSKNIAAPGVFYGRCPNQNTSSI